MSEREPVGNAWGDDISDERKAKLKELADKQHEVARRPLTERLAQSHFRDVCLSGADVFWLAAYTQATARAEINRLVLVSQSEELRHLASPPTDWHHYFTEAQRRLRRNPLDPSDDPDGPLVLHTAMVHLEGANLDHAHLERAHLWKAHLECARLNWAHLEGADLANAHLEGAALFFVHLEGASLVEAHLEEASLRKVHLEDANLCRTHCEGADLSGAYFDKDTFLVETKFNGACLDQVTFDSTKLALVDWGSVSALGEEVRARMSISAVTGEPVEPSTRLGWYLAAVRANRLLAVALRAQGMNEDADRFAYRAQLMQRVVLRRQAFLRMDRKSDWMRARLPREEEKRINWSERLRKFAAYLGSGLLDLIAGYGYRPGRSILAYIVIICGFAGLYLINGQFAAPHLRWDEALVLSISSFHGRGFFTSGISLGDSLARLAAGEAIIGLLLEITFIATFTNRFFAR